MTTDPKKQIPTPTESLMMAILTRNMDDVRSALADGADPTESTPLSTRSYLEIQQTPYAELIHRIWYSPVNDNVDFILYVEMLEYILKHTRIPIPEKDCPWEKVIASPERRNDAMPDLDSEFVDETRLQVEKLAKAVKGYQDIKGYAATKPDSLLLREGRLAFPNPIHPFIDGWEIIGRGKEVLQGSLPLFHTLIKDNSLWASSADAANYAQAIAEIATGNRKTPPLHLPWTNRILDEDQKKSTLGKYASDELPAPGGKR